MDITSGSVTLTNITIDGSNSNKKASGDDFLVKVGSTSNTPILTIGESATVTKGNGGIILGVAGNSSTSKGRLIIDGGTVSYCESRSYDLTGGVSTSVGGVAVLGGTTFVMNDGLIDHNRGKYSGGINFCYNSSGSATINGGTISNNEFSAGAGGILVDSNGKLILNGGTITGNTGKDDIGGGVGIWAGSASLKIGGGNIPLVVKDNTNASGGSSDLRLFGTNAIERATGVLANGSSIGFLLKSMPSSSNAKTMIVKSSSEGEQGYFFSDRPTIAGVSRIGSAIYLSVDAREGQKIYVDANSTATYPTGEKTSAYRTLEEAYAAAQTNDTIVLVSDITVSSQVKFNQSKKVTIASESNEEGKKYTIRSDYASSDANDSLISITAGSVTFKDVTIDGTDQKNYPGAIKVDNGASATLGEGVTVQDFKSFDGKTGEGQAVVNAQNYSTLTIDGATITGCVLEGGNDSNPASVICTGTGATVEMKDGTVTGNTLSAKGTCIVNVGSSNTPKFYMTGGSISDNSIGSGYAAVYSCGNASTCDIQFGGDAVVYDNMDSSGAQKNICVKKSSATDTSNYIKIQSELTGDAKLGIYTESVGESTLVATGAGSYEIAEGDVEHIISDKAATAAIMFDESGGKVYLSNEIMDEVYVSSTGDDNNDGSRSSPVQTLAKAYSKVRSGGKIILLSDLSQGNTLALNKVKDVTIISADNTEGTDGAKKIYTITRTNDNTLFNISKGSLTLEDVTLTDNAGSGSSRIKALIRVGSGTEFILGSGASVKNVYLTTSSGGSPDWGILVADANGTITMKDGSLIDTCRATSGPVRISGSDARFNMEGGTISNCNSSYGEGSAVYVASGATFTMSGGSITDCGTNGSTRGTIFLHGTGKNNFVMTGGEITGNKAKLGGGVYSVDSTNTITVSGTAKIYGNQGSDLGKMSNIYLASGQTVTIGDDGLTSGASIGVYTASDPTSSDVKFATNANETDKVYFTSDKVEKAGVLYKDGCLYLSTSVKGYTVNIAGMTGVNGTNLVQSGILNSDGSSFANVTLEASDGYMPMTQAQADAIKAKLADTGLTASFNDGVITISIESGKSLEDNVSLDLSSILTGDLAPEKGEAKIETTVYSTLSGALDAASSGQTVEIVNPDIGALGNVILKNGVILKDITGNRYKADGNATLDVGTNGSITLKSGKIEATAASQSSATVDVQTGNEVVQVSVGEGTEVTIDSSQKTATVGAKKSVTIGDVIYTAGGDEGSSSFSLTSGGLQTNGDSAVVPGNTVADQEISLGSGDGSKTITILGADKGDVTITKGESSSTVQLAKSGDTFEVGDSKYKAGSDGATFIVEDSSVSISSGSAELESKDSISGGSSGKNITSVDGSGGRVVVVAGGNDGNDVVIIPEAGGKVNVGGTEYTTSQADTRIEITGNANKLTKGAVQLDKDETIDLAGLSIKNGSDDGEKIGVESTGESTGTVTVPEGGSVSIGKTTEESSIETQIEAAEGDAEIGIGEDGKLAVTLNAGESVKIGDVTYTNDSTSGTAVLTVDPSTGMVTGISGDIETQIQKDKLTEDYSYELLPGESVTIGNYTYTAPTGGQKGDVKIAAGQDGGNPSVILNESGNTVNVTHKDHPTDPIQYKAASSGAKFAMSTGDGNAKNIDLLGTDSKIGVVQGVTVKAGSDVITAAGANVQIGMTSSGGAKLISGRGTSTGTMSATIRGVGDKSFSTVSGGSESGPSYTVDTGGELILNASGSVKMDGNATFTGTSGQAFAIRKVGDDTVATIPSDASITGKDLTISGGVAEVKIGADGALTLVGGVGTVVGPSEGTNPVEVEGVVLEGGSYKTKTANVVVPSGETVTIDMTKSPPTVKGLSDDGDEVEETISGLNGDSSADPTQITLTSENPKAVVPGGKTATVKFGNEADSLEVSVPGGDGSNVGKTTFVLDTSGSGYDSITIEKAGDSFKLKNGTEYIAGSADTAFGIKENEVKLNSGSTTLSGGKSIVGGGSGETIVGSTSTDVNLAIKVEVGDGQDIVTIPASGQATIDGTTYSNSSTDTEAKIKVTGTDVELVSGGVNIGDQNGITVCGLAVENRSGGTCDVSVSASGTTGTISVPSSGIVQIGQANITSTNGTSVSIVDGYLEVKVPVTIGDVSYTGGADVKLTVDPRTGEVIGPTAGVQATISTDKLTSGYAYELLPGESVTIGDYTYTAPTGGQKGDVTIVGRGGDENPAVVLRSSSGTVNVEHGNADASVQYVSTSAGTKFAMSSTDQNANNIDLLKNGSGVKVAQGVGVTGGTSIITAASADSQIEMVDGEAKLVSGKGSSTGTMNAIIKGVGDKNFEAGSENMSYTIDTTGQLILGAEGSVKMGDGISFAGESGQSFSLSSGEEGDVVVSVPEGANISTANQSIASVSGDNAQVKVEIGSDGSLTLIEGSGTSNSGMDALIGGKSYSFEVESGSGGFTVDSDAGMLSVPSGTTVEDDRGVEYIGNGSFILSEDASGSSFVTVPAGASIVGSDGATISGGEAKVEIGADGKLALVGGKGSISGGASVDMEFTVFEDGKSVTKTVQVHVPAGSSATLDMSNIPNEVRGLGEGISVTISEVTYKAVGASENSKDLTEDGQKTVVSGDATEDVTVKLGTEPGISVVVPESNEGDTTLVKGNPNTVVIEKAGDSFTVDNKRYTAGSDGAVFTIDENKNVKIETGSTILKDGDSILGGGSGKAISNPEDTGDDQVVVEAGNGKNTITVSGSRSVTIGDQTYQNGSKSDSMIIEATGSGNTLIGGKVLLAQTPGISIGEVSIVKTNGNGQATGQATGGGQGIVTIPEGDVVTVGTKSIAPTDGEVTVDIGQDGTLEVTVQAGKTVKIGGVDYKAPETGKVKLTIDSEGKISGDADVIYDGDELDENTEIQLKSGQSVTIGKYVYTAPTGISDGDITITGRGAGLSPAISLKTNGGTVDVALAKDLQTKTTYTASNANTKFAMDASDSNTKNIVLLDNGSSDANSKMVLPSGITEKAGGNTITGVEGADTTVVYDEATGKSKLVSGTAVSNGKMDVELTGSGLKSFDGKGTEYTVSVDGVLTLKSGSSDSHASVEMGEKIVFEGKANDVFSITKDGEIEYVTIPVGAAVSGEGCSIEGIAKDASDSASKDTKIQIDESGALTLVQGKGWISGGVTVKIQSSDGGSETESVDVDVPDGGRCKVDSKDKIVSDLGEGGRVTIGGITYTSNIGRSSFPLDGKDARLVIDRDRAEVGAGKDASITLGEGSSPVVTVPASSGSNVGDITIEKASDGGIVTVGKTGDGFEVGGMTYIAGSDGAMFSVDDESDVKLVSGSATLNNGRSLETDNGNKISGSEGTSEVTIGSGNDIVTIPSAGGKVKIGGDSGTEYTSAENDTQIEVTSGSSKLIKGAVLLDSGEGISIDGISIIGDGSPSVTARSSGDGTGVITVPQGGQAVIGGATVGSSDGDVTIEIKDGKPVVKIDAGKTVTINGQEIEGAENGTTRTIDPSTGGIMKSTVVIDTGTGSEPVIEEKAYDIGETIKLPDENSGIEPPKPQQILVGWKTTEGETTAEYGLGSDYLVGGDVKVEAVYADASNVLIYSVEDGGSVTGTTYEVLDGSPVKLKEDGAQREGYTFAGWKAKDGNGAAFAPGISLDATQTTYMEAYFIPKSVPTVKLIYEPEGGDGNVGEQIVKVRDTVWLPTALDMSRDGYKFVGWATEGSSTNVDPTTTGADLYGRTMIEGQYYQVNENETLYAVWEVDAKNPSGPIFIVDDDDPIVIIPDSSKTDDDGTGTKVHVAIALAAAIVLVEIFILVEYRRD